MELLSSKPQCLGGRKIHPPLKVLGDREFVGRLTGNRAGSAAQKTP